MDALSTHPVSSLLPKSFTSTNPNQNTTTTLLKPQPPSTSNHPPPLSTSTNSLSNKSNHQSLTKPIPLPLSVFSTPPHPLKQTHRRAATGYAAALLDVACCDGALRVVARDARRVKRVVEAVMEGEGMEERVKSEVVSGVVEGGGFYGRLVVLVRMLVAKGNKVGVVGEVMDEFGRLWEELCGVKKAKGKRKDLATFPA